jgi:hypothetical protein
MSTSIRNRLQHAWNAFLNRERDPTLTYESIGVGYGVRPDRVRLGYGNEKSIVTSIYNKIAIDVAAIPIKHVRLDENDRYIETIQSSLNDVLTVSANIDQTGRNLFQDAVISMFDEGCVAIIPIDTTINPTISGSYEIQSLRVAKILEWYPSHIRVRVYDERDGQKKEITVPKNMAAIIENPFYSIMNEQNSILKRLIRKLNLLDAIDEQSGSGKLDLIIQLPYVIKTEARRKQAEDRRKDIEDQLAGSKYGIAYADATEKITQLNRPAENNLMGQIEYLTSMLYAQLGLTENIFNGTAKEEEMLNYFNRTIEPILAALIDEMKRKFLTKTARTQLQSIGYFRDAFRLTPIQSLTEAADKFTRNEILSSNEFRAIIGYKPSNDPAADELRNKNIQQNNTKGEDQNVNNGEEV